MEKIPELKLKIKEYQDDIKIILDSIKSINWDDPVSKVYKSLFKPACIIPGNLDYEELKNEFNERLQFNIPPGYKDKSKDSNNIGDFIIWKEILEIGEKEGKDILFVTLDKKADWYHQSMNSNIYPRYELMYEFKDYSNGKDIYFIDLSTMLKINDIDQDVVRNIEKSENQVESKILYSGLKSHDNKGKSTVSKVGLDSWANKMIKTFVLKGKLKDLKKKELFNLQLLYIAK